MLTNVALLYLQKCLEEHPFPTYRVIRLLHSNSEDLQINHYLEEICYNTLKKLIKSTKNKKVVMNLLSFIASYQPSDEWMDKMYENLIDDLVTLKLKGTFDSNIYLSLIARSHTQDTLLKNFLDAERTQSIWGDLNTKTVFLKVVYHNQHWIYSFLNTQNEIHILNKSLLDHINLFKIINSVFRSNSNSIKTSPFLREYEKRLKSLDENDLFNDNLKFCLFEIKKLAVILSVLQPKFEEVNLKKIGFFEEPTAIHCLLRNFEVKYSNLALFQEFIRDIAALTQKQHKICDTIDDLSATTFFQQYIIAKLFLDKIAHSAKESNDIDICHLLNIKTQYTPDIVFMIETIISLLFLNTNCLTHKNLSQKHSKFICDKTVLKTVLDSLSSVLKAVCSNSNDMETNLKLNLDNLHKIVERALDKFSIIDNFPKKVLERTDSYYKLFDCERESKTSSPVIRKCESTESIEDSRHLSYFKESILMDKQEENLSSEPENDISAVIDHEFSADSFMSKMLMDPYSLVNVCMRSNQDLKEARRVLEVSF